MSVGNSFWQYVNAKNAWRAYNFGVGAFVTGNMIVSLMEGNIADPLAFAVEQGIDATIHLTEAIFPNTFNGTMLTFNFARGVQAGFAYATNYAFPHIMSTIPKPANGADMFNHLGAVIKRFDNIREQTAPAAGCIVEGLILRWFPKNKSNASKTAQNDSVSQPDPKATKNKAKAC